MIQTQSSSTEVYEGESLELECKVEGEPPPLVQWHKGEIVSCKENWIQTAFTY